MITEFSVQITPERTIPIPDPLWQELALQPRQTIYLRRDAGEDRFVIHLLTRQQIGERIVELMKDALHGTTWSEIEAGRIDDGNRG